MTDDSKFTPRSPAFSRLAREAGGERRSKTNALRGEALRRVNYEMANAGVDHPPANLERLARHVGVKEIRYVPLAMHARLVMMDNTVVAEVNEKLDSFSRRRAIAHELAHVVLERERISGSASAGLNLERSIPHSLIEKLCDLCGDEILAPRYWLAKSLEESDGSLTSVSQLAADILV